VVSAVIAGFGSAIPAPAEQRSLWEEVFAERYANAPRARAIWRAAGVRTRGRVADPRVEDLRNWGTEARMRRFMADATPLGKGAVAEAMGRAGIEARDVDLFTVVSCTGYATPGLDVLLARDLGMRPDVERLSVGHMGCHAAVPALSVAADAARARRRTSVVLSVELSSLHVQDDADDPQQVVVHALFGDAAAACVVAPSGAGLEVLDSVSRTDATAAPLMTWDITDHGFRMGLASEVPHVLAAQVRPTVEALLARNGLAIGDVRAWAVHPGGPRILEATADRLGLAPDALAVSRSILRDRGNTSSASLLLILERLVEQEAMAPGDPVVGLAFGPGLTLAAVLMRRRSRA
jgi:predicted naringenin-chalcone synthase